MTDVYYSVDEHERARDEAEALREEEWCEAHHEGQLDDKIQITWMRRRRPAVLVGAEDFERSMLSQHGHMFSGR
jgi:hypothetical protein